jgi:predicted metal-binding membrane protein
MLSLHRATQRAPDRRPLIAAVGGLSLVAWLTLLLWGQSADARFLHHEGAAGASAGGAEATLFVIGWTVMVIAMMLPTSLPLIAMFGALVERRGRPGLLVGLLVVAYLVVWTGFGLVVYLADRVLHLVVAATPWLADHAILITAATLAVAGAYQFSPLKYRCLDECRSPLGFVLAHWSGRHERFEAFRMGILHGLFCVGCCWSLMLVMFAVGLGSLAWMLVLGIAMAIEKNVAWGRRISRPLGVVLILGAVLAVSG